MKVLLKRFHLNGHIIEFCLQTQKIEFSSRCPKLKVGVNVLQMMESCEVILTFESVDKILWCDHSNETFGSTFTWC